MNEIDFADFKNLLYRVRHNSITFNFYPHRATLNYYVGCKFGCKYCYAWYAVKKYNLDIKDFPHNLIVKIDSISLLEDELNKNKWRSYRGIIQLGNLQDVYQPLELKYRLTRRCLSLFNKYRKSCVVLTKSNLILRDIDILSDMAKDNLIHIDMSIAHTDERLRKAIEPYAPRIEKRFECLKMLNEKGISTGIFIDPVLPYYTLESLEDIFKKGKEVRVNYIFIGFLHLRYWRYEIVKEQMSSINSNVDFDDYMSFRRKVTLKQDYLKMVIQKAVSYSLKYDIPIATPYPEYTNCDFNFGAFLNRHPLIYDHIENLYKYKGEFIDLRTFISEYDHKNLDRIYLNQVKKKWNNNEIFNKIKFLNIQMKKIKNTVYYKLEDDYLTKEFYYKKIKNNINYGTKKNSRLFI